MAFAFADGTLVVISDNTANPIITADITFFKFTAGNYTAIISGYGAQTIIITADRSINTAAGNFTEILSGYSAAKCRRRIKICIL